MSKLRERMVEDMDLAGYAERTKESYLGAVKSLAQHYRQSPEKLTDEDLRRFFLYLINERGVHPSTVRTYLAGIKFFYERTLRRKLPFFELACPKKCKKLPVVLSSAEVATILEKVCKPVPRVALTLIYSCGLRLSEARNLLVQDIDSQRMQLAVRSGKGAKDRYVPLPNKTLDLLRSYWLLCRPTYWMFPNKKNDGPVNDSILQKAFRSALELSGINKAASVHTLRHSYATHLLEEAVDLRVIQEILGHSSPNTTAIYTHLTQKSINTLKGALENLLPAN